MHGKPPVRPLRGLTACHWQGEEAVETAGPDYPDEGEDAYSLMYNIDEERDDAVAMGAPVSVVSQSVHGAARPIGSHRG